MIFLLIFYLPDLRNCHQEKKELKEELCLMVDCNYQNAKIVCPERCLKGKKSFRASQGVLMIMNNVHYSKSVIN